MSLLELKPHTGCSIVRGLVFTTHDREDRQERGTFPGSPQGCSAVCVGPELWREVWDADALRLPF